jgi:hypothetical protein
MFGASRTAVCGKAACTDLRGGAPSNGRPYRDRRDFITLLGGAAAAWPLAARGQQPAKVARIGLLLTGSLESPEGRLGVDALRQGLHQYGYIEGQNIIIEYRAADGRFDRLAGLASVVSGCDASASF